MFLLILGLFNKYFYLKLNNYENFQKILLYVSLIFCAIFVFFIFISNLNKMSEYLAYSTFYSISLPHDRLLDNAYPRTTGLSRLFAVVNIFLIAFYLKINPNKKKLAFFILIITTVFGTIIWGFQSRGTIICYFSAVLIIIFLFKNENKSKFLNFFLILILPILVFNGSRKIYFKDKFNIEINSFNKLTKNEEN